MYVRLGSNLEIKLVLHGSSHLSSQHLFLKCFYAIASMSPKPCSSFVTSTWTLPIFYWNKAIPRLCHIRNLMLLP